ncbi:endonuclease VII domain-containing protein [Klebsiella variicola]|nr:endonuclease VII domain-containing protein [Klebsiella variicola]
MQTETTCKYCGFTAPTENFPKKGKRNNQQRYRNICFDCYNERQEHHKHYQLKRNFGLTLEAYNVMLSAQGGVCAICGGNNPNGRSLAVDHDHETGKIRQLLCSNCNTGIGLLKDNPELLIRASAYLLRHKH